MQLNYNILIVDDIVANIQVAMNVLKEENYNFTFATSGDDALKLLRKNPFDLVLLDIMMPLTDGYEVCRQMKNDPLLSDIPVVFLSARADIDAIDRGFSLGGVDYLSKPFHPAELLARVKTHLELHHAKELLKQNNLSLHIKVKKNEERLLSELEYSQKELIFVLTELMESSSDETGKHIRRVAEISRLLAHHCEYLDEDDAEVIFYAAPMHDIGKITIPEAILHKKGKLTADEFVIMKTHTSNAFSALDISNRKIIKAAAIIAHEHHEKWDGSGYPRALKNDEIHIYGRIVALADVFDALTHKRVYKDEWTVDDAIQYIIDSRGTHFDPELVDVFKEHIDDFIAILQD